MTPPDPTTATMNASAVRFIDSEMVSPNCRAFWEGSTSKVALDGRTASMIRANPVHADISGKLVTMATTSRGRGRGRGRRSQTVQATAGATRNGPAASVGRSQSLAGRSTIRSYPRVTARRDERSSRPRKSRPGQPYASSPLRASIPSTIASPPRTSRSRPGDSVPTRVPSRDRSMVRI